MAKRIDAAGEVWSGWRRLRIAARRLECEGVARLELEPEPQLEEGGALPPYVAGQYLTVRLQAPGWTAPEVRCYSLCDAPGEGPRYAIAVKRVTSEDGARPGRVSSALVSAARNDVLEARAPMGSFVVPPGGRDPIVLIAGGIGITPLRSIARALALADDPRPIHLFYGVRHGGEHAFKDDLAALARAWSRLRLEVAYSRPRPEDRPGVDYQRAGRLTTDLLATALPPADRPYAFYVCGPPAMTDDLLRGLGALGVPAGQVHVEAFGAPTIRPITRRLAGGALAGAPPAVTFARASKTVPWDPARGSLLELGMANDVFVPFACAAGRCGTCATALLSGAVEYPFPPAFRLRPGTCLPCVAVPAGPVTLDA